MMSLVIPSPDFTVKLWDLFHGNLIHTFAVHGGAVRNIVTCPPDINVSAYQGFIHLGGMGGGGGAVRNIVTCPPDINISAYQGFIHLGGGVRGGAALAPSNHSPPPPLKYVVDIITTCT